VSRPTLRYPQYLPFHIQGYHLLWLNFPEHFARINIDYGNWAVPISFATTFGISIDFFSSGYLDGSVPQVRLIELFYSPNDFQINLEGFPHSEISGSKLICQLPEAYRRLPRPSSPLTAKASTVYA
jgi:hypothetical protein